MERYYLDTCIWLDLYEKRGINGEHAQKLMHKILKENNVVLFSDLHIKELKQLDFSAEEIKCIFSTVLPNNSRHVHIYQEELIEARRIASQRRIPLGDVIHAIIARDNDSILVSRDMILKRSEALIYHENQKNFVNYLSYKPNSFSNS